MLEFVALVVASALSRRFGIALPGKGFASLILGITLYALLNYGWPTATLVTTIGVPSGDFLFRRLRLRAGLRTAAHLAIGTILVGGVYEALGGATGSAALQMENLVPLVVVTVLLPVVTNGTFYLELAAHGLFRRVDPRLIARWETLTFASAAGLALGATAVAREELPPGARVFFGVVLAGVAIGAWYALRLGIRADELRLVQHLARAIAANADLEASFGAIRSLTGELLPWEHMGLAYYRARRNEIEIINDTALPRGRTARLPADRGLTGEAVRRRRPVVAGALSQHEIVVPGRDRPGSEILVPLHQGDDLIGLWSVRHSDPTIYRESDGEILDLIAPQLALSLSLHELVSPLASTSDEVTSHLDRLSSTAKELHGHAEDVAGAAGRAEDGAARAANLVVSASSRSATLARAAADAAAAGADTSTEGESVEDAALRIRTATQDAVQRLARLDQAVATGTDEVTRLRGAAQEIERFSETIAGIAAQTNLLALNATIEAARAGTHGRSFGVVAEEVAKLAEQSSGEASKVAHNVAETRAALDRAAALLERLRADVGDVVKGSEIWAGELEEIVGAAERTAAAGRRIADLAVQTRHGSAAIADQLGEAESVAAQSASEAEAVAKAARAQFRTVEELARGAAELTSLAERLVRATEFVRGNGAT
jgi:methyl-accepting chemotaxis protein